MSEDNNKIDITPLIAIQKVHKDRHRTSKLLEKIFNDFEVIFPNLKRNDQFLYRSYIERLIIQNVCQYVEDVGSYSVACKETGLVYVERVVSVTSNEIGNFFSNVDKLTEADIQKIFRIHPDNKPPSSFNCEEIKNKYLKLKVFKKKYQGLYNAMKHGNRVLCHELHEKDFPMDSLNGTLIGFTWIEVDMHKRLHEIVKDLDGSPIEIALKDRKSNIVILPSDDVSDFVNVAEDCHWIINNILKNNTPQE